MNVLSAVLFIVTLSVAIVLLLSSYGALPSLWFILFGVAGAILALLFVGVQLYTIADRLTARQSS